MTGYGYLRGTLVALVLFFYGNVAAQDKVAFVSVSPGDLAAGVFPKIEKHILDLGGGSAAVVDEFPYETLESGRYGEKYYWSPDRTKAITFSDQGIFVTDASGGHEVLIGSTSGRASAPDLHWSPDGTKIALSLGPSGRRQIHVVDADGGNLTNLSNSTRDDYLPNWSPDGTRIAFTSSQGFDTEVYVMNADGDGQINLTDYPDVDYLSSWSPQGPWSPDGTKILFLSYRNGSSDIFVMNADGSNLINLTGSMESEDSPVWSPDGTRIAYVVQFLGAGGLIFGDIFTMSADGMVQTNLTNSPSVNDQNPFWIAAGLASVIEAQSWGQVKSTIHDARK
jgi:TolB protein